jgi:hypothetical protein
MTIIVDTVEHTFLLTRLEKSFGVNGLSLGYTKKFRKFYFRNKSFRHLFPVYPWKFRKKNVGNKVSETFSVLTVFKISDIYFPIDQWD